MDRFRAVWGRAPATLRKTIVAVLGGTIVLLGLALVVLPGPFTLPLLILGFAILGSEFAWATRALNRVKAGMEKGAEIGKAGIRKGVQIGQAGVRAGRGVARLPRRRRWARPPEAPESDDRAAPSDDGPPR